MADSVKWESGGWALWESPVTNRGLLTKHTDPTGRPACGTIASELSRSNESVVGWVGITEGIEEKFSSEVEEGSRFVFPGVGVGSVSNSGTLGVTMHGSPVGGIEETLGNVTDIETELSGVIHSTSDSGAGMGGVDPESSPAAVLALPLEGVFLEDEGSGVSLEDEGSGVETEACGV